LLEIVSSLFSRVLSFYPFSKKSSKIKFLKKFQKNLYKFLCQKGIERHLGDTRRGCHATTCWNLGVGFGPWPNTNSEILMAHSCLAGVGTKV
jgi:hypothetical protein